jgi:hypothetical protein
VANSTNEGVEPEDLLVLEGKDTEEVLKIRQHRLCELRSTEANNVLIDGSVTFCGGFCSSSGRLPIDCIELRRDVIPLPL